MKLKVNVAIPQKEGMFKILEIAMLASVGVALTYFSQNISAKDFGTYGPLVAGVLTVFAGAVRQIVVLENPPENPDDNQPV